MEDYRQRNRKFFEDKLRRERTQIALWLRYAAWEEGQGEWPRARSIYERALDVDPYNVTVWLRYGEMEMGRGHVALARNVWDRAVTIQPRVDQFWYKYVLMEERLGQIEAARAVYERWMAWKPEEAIWMSYIKFERRHRQWARIRCLHERLVTLHSSSIEAWLAWAKFEEEGEREREKAGRTKLDKESETKSMEAPVEEPTTRDIGIIGISKHSARDVFERAFSVLERPPPRLYIEFAKYEVRQGEVERARVIYKYALEQYPRETAGGLWNSYAQFERMHGDPNRVTDVVLEKRRALYEERISASGGMDYDAWFALLRLEEEEANSPVDVVRETYERAIACMPPAPEKRLWRRYIYLWIYYAVYEECVAQDGERALAVYRAALDVIPHQAFTFAKLWLLTARRLIRQGDLSAARRLLGRALGTCPKDRLFRGYIELELALREFDRCRTLYERWLEWEPTRAATWLAYAELERALLDEERARALYELAISEELDEPESVWKAYIEWEASEGREEAAVELYERLLERTEHVRVWVTYANWEASGGRLKRARAIFERAVDSLKRQGLVAERILLLEAWREVEESTEETTTGSEEMQESISDRAAILEKISRMMPRQVKRLGTEGEELTEYVFPEEEDRVAGVPGSKLLAMAHQWKQDEQQ